nr:MAG TPA: hypothetical protein [Caudoviricetes sp.]
MVYTLDKADQRCDVTYVDWSKKYSPIPKATCEMIQPKCSSGGGGGSYDDSVELKCEDLKKLIHGEDKPKEEEKPKEDKPTTDEVTPKENEPAPSPKVDENPTEPTPEPPVADTPREDTPTEGDASDHLGDTPTGDTPEVNLLELMPRVEDKFSKVYFNGNSVTSVGENSPEEKVAFENKIITKLKGKLPEGTVVEAVLSEPFFKEGSEFVTDKTNYTLHVRVTLKGKVYEQEYNVPNEAFAVPIDSI